MTIRLSLLLCGAAAAFAFFVWSGQQRDARQAALEAQTIADGGFIQLDELGNIKILSRHTPQSANFAGAFLAAQFAQRQQEWSKAAEYLDRLNVLHPNEPAVLKKSLVLKMGANEPEAAIQDAYSLLALPQSEQDESVQTLARVFAVTGAFKNGDYEEAEKLVDAMPYAGLTLFMKPLLKGWIDVTNGTLNSQNLQSHPMLILQNIYMADYLGKRKAAIALLDKLTQQGETMSAVDLERIADLYMHFGETEKGYALFEHLVTLAPQVERFKSKMTDYDPALSLYTPITDPKQGLARAYYDMAFILFQDQSDDSARIFANMALYLDSDLYEANILLGSIAARQGDYGDAIAYYNLLPEDTIYSDDAPLEIARFYEDAGHYDRAIDILQQKFASSGQLEALIFIGDIHRRQDNFQAALEVYNQAYTYLGDDASSNKWRLLYARGMAREQLGQWDLAYQDLSEALALQPNHPYILNYLGYAMADRGLDLDRALGMIQQALALQPQDGAITDSLGWVYYRMGEYEKAVPYLEKAVELLPSDAVVNDHLGDAYWKTGRKLEARYQWLRARGYSEDIQLISAIDKKIENGLHILKPLAVIKAADTQY